MENVLGRRHRNAVVFEVIKAGLGLLCIRAKDGGGSDGAAVRKPGHDQDVGLYFKCNGKVLKCLWRKVLDIFVFYKVYSGSQ